MIDHALATTWRAALALAIGGVGGIVIGVALGLVPRGRRFEGALSALATIPGMALAPLAMMAWGFGDLPIVAVAAVAAAFPAALHSAAAVRSAPVEPVEAALVDGAGPWASLVRVRLPVVAAVVMEGFSLAMTKAWRTVIAVEFVAAASRGLGYAAQDAAEYMRFGDVFVAGAVTVALHFVWRSAVELVRRAVEWDRASLRC